MTRAKGLVMRPFGLRRGLPRGPHLIHRHESGVEEWMALFDDPDGHLLALMAQVPPAA